MVQDFVRSPLTYNFVLNSLKFVQSPFAPLLLLQLYQKIL